MYLCHQMRHFAGVFNEVLRILDDPRRYHSYYDEGELAYILLTTDQCAVIAGDDLLALLDDEESDLPALPASPIQMVTVAVPQRVRYSDWDGSREIAAAFPLGHSAVLTSRRWADYDGGLSFAGRYRAAWCWCWSLDMGTGIRQMPRPSWPFIRLQTPCVLTRFQRPARRDCGDCKRYSRPRAKPSTARSASRHQPRLPW